MKFDQLFSEQEFLKIRELAPSSNIAMAPGTVPGQQMQQDPQAQAKMMAQQALDRQTQKKELQDQIKAKQSELQALQQQLTQIK